MSCTKKRFCSHSEAKRSLRTLRRRKSEFDSAYVYHCESCHGWHIGHRW